MLAVLCLSTPVTSANTGSIAAMHVYDQAPQQSSIKVNLLKGSYVLLRVFDPLGNLVFEAYNGKLPAGDHNLSLNINKLKPGVYFYRLQVDDKVETKKLLIH